MAISLNFLGLIWLIFFLIERGCGSSWRARTGFGENEMAEGVW